MGGVGAGSPDPDEAAAGGHEGADLGHQLRIRPLLAPGEGGALGAGADKDLDVRGQAGAHVVEGQELHVHRQSRQRLEDPQVGVGLAVPQGVRDHMRHPGAQAAPGVDDRDLEAGGQRTQPRGALVDGAELRDDLLDAVDEIGVLHGQGQVAAVADPVQGGAHDGAPGLQPAAVGLGDGIAPRVEDIGEEVRQEPALGVAHVRDVGDHPAGRPRSDRADDGVQAGGGEVLAVGLGADPVVAQEHHRLLALGVDGVGQLAHPGAHEALLEVDPVAEGAGGDPEGGVVVAGVDEVLGGQAVAVLLLEGLQCGDAHRGGVAEPVDEALGGVGAVDEGEVVEEGGEADHVHLGVLREPGAQVGAHVGPRGLVAHVEGLLLDARGVLVPAVGEVVVHLGRVPGLDRQEADGVDVPGEGLVHGDGAPVGLDAPRGGGQLLTGGAVVGLPPARHVAAGVGADLVGEPGGQQVDAHGAVGSGGDPVGHEEDARGLIGVGVGPGVVAAAHEVGGVDLGGQLRDDAGQLGAVGVPHGVGAQAGDEAADLLIHAGLDRQGEASPRLRGERRRGLGLERHQHSFGLNSLNSEQTTACGARPLLARRSICLVVARRRA